MPADRRPFRIETGMDAEHEERDLRPAVEPVDSTALFERVFQELADIKGLVQQGMAVAPADARAANGPMRSEVALIHHAISQTKREILNLQVKGLRGDSSSRALDELDAVVNGTEAATETILSAAETVEETAGRLLAKLGGADQAMVVEIHKQAIRIFEACNFQDLTGQRIGKVVQVLHFIEDRVATMMSIWGGEEGFSFIPDQDAASDRREGDAALLNGPPLKADVDVVSQDDIDSLFS
ncbi:chemotaxis protein CheZ [Pseudochelatococcus lubricantis]|uniref:Chemotaxis protein CheZ n=1 Tax=Pseudochelatococcus lubricantis TaxID=1538102 RepID=A0ABX0V199_9HYPH|nr:protein phosphatase CheZ [Pseudochelatococcus lubricantis]NIJ58070.1 chemotaxis protein CheZ [Pseudochelatococcus lubricantis]